MCFVVSCGSHQLLTLSKSATDEYKKLQFSLFDLTAAILPKMAKMFKNSHVTLEKVSFYKKRDLINHTITMLLL